MGSTIINTYPPTKKMFGDKEVLKEVWNGETVYEPTKGDAFIKFTSNNPFSVGVYNNAKKWNGVIETSVDNSVWTVWDGSSPVNASLIEEKYTLFMRGSNCTTFCQFKASDTAPSGYLVITSLNTADIAISGNLYALLKYDVAAKNNYTNISTRGTFAGLFKNNTKIVDAENLIIPPYFTGDTCCYQLFYGCSSLQKAPASFGINSRGSEAYGKCFAGCSSLVQPPVFDVSGNYNGQIGNLGMNYMFQNCTSLEEPPKMGMLKLYKNNTSSSAHYGFLFSGCTKLKKLPKIEFTNIDTKVINYIFENCSQIKFADAQDATYKNAYSIPYSANNEYATVCTRSFKGTGGTYSVADGNYTYNTIVYTSNEIVG